MAESNGIHNENSNSKDLPELKTTKPITLDSSGIMAKAWVIYLQIFIQKRFIRYNVSFLQFKQYFDDDNFPEWTKGSRGITVPLSFPEKESSPSLDEDRLMVCLLCEENFIHPGQRDDFLRHLTQEHRFVIGQVKLVADLPSYVAYWRNKFVQAKVVTDYCSVLKMKMEGEDVEQDYFLLSDILAEDKELRMHLQRKKLEHVLSVQEKQRNNTDFKRSCFFCRTTFEGSYAKLLDHMAFDHNFR